MNRIFVISISAILILMVVIVSFSNDSGDINETTFTVYADSNPITIDKLVNELESHPHYKNSNNTTIQWLKSKSGVVFSSMDNYVVMSTFDAGKLPIELATDVIVKDTFTCTVKEKRPLGNDLNDIVFVDNVRFEYQNITPGWADA